MTDAAPEPDTRTFVAERADDGTRLDVALTRWLAGVRTATRTRLQRWVDAGKVRINGRVTMRAARRLRAGDCVEIALPWRRRVADHQPEDVPLEVLYEDDHLLVVAKPAGMIVHPTGHHRTGTLFNALLWRARDWPSGTRPGLVHRLDRDTSGVVLVAKSRSVHARTVRLLRGPRARKRYLAVVAGEPPCSGVLRMPLMRVSDAPPRMGPAPPGEGLPCETRYDVLTRGSGVAAGLTLVACDLVTGRLHQIRAHLLAAGWPIVGDSVYGPDVIVSRLPPAGMPLARRPADPLNSRHAVCIERQALHAWQLVIPHPVSDDLLELTAPIPPDMQAVIDRLEA